IQVPGITLMGAFYFAGVLDGAPVLFRQGANFPRIGKQPVAITAIQAIDLLHQVQVAQMAMVKHNIVRAFHERDTVEAKRCRRVDQQAQIQDEHGNDHPVNKGGRQYIAQLRTGDVMQQVLLDTFMPQIGRFLKLYALSPEMVVGLFLLLLQTIPQLVIQLANLIKDFLNAAIWHISSTFFHKATKTLYDTPGICFVEPVGRLFTWLNYIFWELHRKSLAPVTCWKPTVKKFFWIAVCTREAIPCRFPAKAAHKRISIPRKLSILIPLILITSSSPMPIWIIRACYPNWCTRVIADPSTAPMAPGNC